jgi:hypothetical protein
VTQTRRFSRPLTFAVVVACLSLAACTGPATQADGNREDADTSNGPTPPRSRPRHRDGIGLSGPVLRRTERL